MSQKDNNICDEIHDIPFGDRLALAMKMTGDTRTSLAAKIKVSEAMVRQYLAGTAYPKLNVFYRITRVMDISAGWFLEELDEIHPPEDRTQRDMAFVAGILGYLNVPQQHLLMKQLVSMLCKFIDEKAEFDADKLQQLTPSVINTALYLQQLPDEKRKEIITLYTEGNGKSRATD